ncbi:MAG: PspC domain-containing protein, partial [Nocardioides sp.]
MTTTEARPAYRRATRDLESPMVGGVASGLAQHLGQPVLWVRVGFVVATALSGLGLVLYAAFWVMLPAPTAFASSAPGLESASRGGRRPARRRRLVDVGPIIVLAALGLGAIFVVEAVFGQGAIF